MRNRIPKTLDNPVRAIGIPIDTLIIGGVIWVILFLLSQIWEKNPALAVRPFKIYNVGYAVL